MLLTIGLGAGIALALFPQISGPEAFILAAILAPTDAGLGQIIVSDPRVPMKVRQALNVEAGLNDGLSVPFLLFFVALELSGGASSDARLWHFIVEQLIYGCLIGMGLGFVGGWLLGTAHRQQWITKSWQQLSVVTLPLLAFIVSEHFHASMFIAAFVAGLCAQVGFKEIGKHSVQFAEEWGQIINLSVFMLFGFIVAREWGQLSLLYFVCGAASLTIVRMVPVTIALWGTGLRRSTVLFMGWFGPRGLASIVLALVYVASIAELADETINYAVMATVLLSIFLHCTSAMPLLTRYGRYVSGLDNRAPEAKDS